MEILNAAYTGAPRSDLAAYTRLTLTPEFHHWPGEIVHEIGAVSGVSALTEKEQYREGVDAPTSAVSGERGGSPRGDRNIQGPVIRPNKATAAATNCREIARGGRCMSPQSKQDIVER